MDDVFVPEFGFVLVEKASSNDTASSRLLPPNFSDTVYQLDTTQLLSDLTELPSGPYILHGPNLYQAWRLYGDQFEAFTTGVIPEDVNAPGQ